MLEGNILYGARGIAQSSCSSGPLTVLRHERKIPDLLFHKHPLFSWTQTPPPFWVFPSPNRASKHFSDSLLFLLHTNSVQNHLKIETRPPFLGVSKGLMLTNYVVNVSRSACACTSSQNRSAHAGFLYDLYKQRRKASIVSLHLVDLKTWSPQQLKRQVREGMPKAKTNYFTPGKAIYSQLWDSFWLRNCTRICEIGGGLDSCKIKFECSLSPHSAPYSLPIVLCNFYFQAKDGAKSQ